MDILERRFGFVVSVRTHYLSFTRPVSRRLADGLAMLSLDLIGLVASFAVWPLASSTAASVYLSRVFVESEAFKRIEDVQISPDERVWLLSQGQITILSLEGALLLRFTTPPSSPTMQPSGHNLRRSEEGIHGQSEAYASLAFDPLARLAFIATRSSGIGAYNLRGGYVSSSSKVGAVAAMACCDRELFVCTAYRVMVFKPSSPSTMYNLDRAWRIRERPSGLCVSANGQVFVSSSTLSCVWVRVNILALFPWVCFHRPHAFVSTECWHRSSVLECCVRLEK